MSHINHTHINPNHVVMGLFSPPTKKSSFFLLPHNTKIITKSTFITANFPTTNSTTHIPAHINHPSPPLRAVTPPPLQVDMSTEPLETYHSFEGPEKVLEVWFVPPSEYEDNSERSTKTLLDITQPQWETMLALVNCQILSSIEHGKGRAYLLSESSLFVYEYQMIIKTCGTTTLLNCISKLLELAEGVGLTKVDNVFYNRQNFFFPERQLEPHQGFKAESKVLDSYFANGGAYTVGRVNENHYNFYNAECRMSRNDPAMLERDATLEILMTGLSQDRMKFFYHQNDVSNEEIRIKSGIADFFPQAKIDDYMFEPYGYSLNALMDEGYYTIHITPQPNCSFVSFETNVYLPDYTELISKVLAAFQPERFIVAHLANSLATQELRDENKRLAWSQAALVEKFDLRVQDDIFCHFDHYDLYFNQYTKQKAAQGDASKRRPEGTILKQSSPYQKAKQGNIDDIPAFELGEDLSAQ